MIKTCIVCNKQFEPNHLNIKFCSENCRKRYCNEYQKRYQKNHIKYIKKTCIICGKEFKSNYSKAKCCSNECRKENIKKYRKEYYKKDKQYFQKEEIKAFLNQYCEFGSYIMHYKSFYDSICQEIPNTNRTVLTFLLRKYFEKITKPCKCRNIIGLKFNKKGLEKFGELNLSNLNVEKSNLTSAKACKLLSCDIGREKIKEYYDNLNENDKRLIDLEKTLEKYKEIEKRLFKINEFRNWKTKTSLALYLANSKLITQVDACKIGSISDVTLRSLLNLLKKKKIKSTMTL